MGFTKNKFIYPGLFYIIIFHDKSFGDLTVSNGLQINGQYVVKLIYPFKKKNYLLLLKSYSFHIMLIYVDPSTNFSIMFIFNVLLKDI